MKVTKKKVEKLSDSEIEFMNSARIKEYGPESKIDFKKEDSGATFFFVKEKKEIKAFGMLKNIQLTYKNKKYNIFGMGRGLAIEKGKGYGTVLNHSRLDYAKKKGKTVLAFTAEHNIEFFKKVGFKISHEFIKKIIYKSPAGVEKKDQEGHGVYIEGKDRIISTIVKGKEPAYSDTDFW